MTSNLIRSARRVALTVVIAGAASVAVAPVAFAADSTGGSAYVLAGNGNGGPDSFVVTATGRTPVFFCDDVKPGKDGQQDPKDVAKAVAKAAEEAQKAADETAKDADKADKDAAQDADKEAKKAAKVDEVMKRHNICIVSPSISRF